MIPDEFKQQLLNRIDIVDVIERHVQLRKAGQNYVARCPFHAEKTPSFSVSPAKQFFHCFGCGAHGNAIGFVMEHGGLGYIEAVKELASMVGMTVPDARDVNGAPEAKTGAGLAELLLTAARYYKDCLKHSEPAIAYLKQRGVTGEIAARFGLGFAPDAWQGLAEIFPDYKTSPELKASGLVIEADGGRRYDRFRSRIMFPISNARGGIIGFGGRVIGQGEPKYLNSPETSLFEKGRELYGLFQARQAVRDASRVVVVEGYMDVVALAQHGFDAAVATLGTATTPTHLDKLLKIADEVVFCFDADAAGRRAAWRALEVSLPKLSDVKSVRFLFLPEGDDPDTFVRAHGARAFEARVKEAMPLSEMLLQELRARVDDSAAEGRARLLHLAKPLVTQIAAPALALLLRQRLAAAAEMSLEDVDELFEVRRTSARRGHRPPTEQRARRAPVTLTQWILQAVLHEPALANQVEHSLLDGRDRFTPALRAVLDLIAARPNLEARALVPVALEAIHDPGITGLLQEAQVELLALPAIDLNLEFAHAVQALREQAEDRRRTELSAKKERSEREQAEFEQLLRALGRRARHSAESIHPQV